MMLENIILHKKDRVATITLDRPQAINSLSLSMLHDLEQALQDTEEDSPPPPPPPPASGERGFCAGMDLKDFEQGNLDLGFTRKVLDRLENFSKPTIAAITDGYCITGGLEFALCCDILVASDKAVFGDTHSRVNISGGGAAVRMPRLIGLMKAKHMIFTSQFFDAAAAKDMGLLIDVYPSQQLQDKARAMALEILKQDQVLVRRMKQVMNRGWRTDLYAASALEEAECLRGIQMKLAQGFTMNDAVKQTRSDRT